MRITETKDGAILEVFVKPKSQKFEVTFEGDDVVVRCTEEPVKGKVNKELSNWSQAPPQDKNDCY